MAYRGLGKVDRTCSVGERRKVESDNYRVAETSELDRTSVGGPARPIELVRREFYPLCAAEVDLPRY